MGIKDLAVVRAYHVDRVKRFGVNTSEALGWKNRDSQQRRFQQLARLGDFRGRSVLDVGCGHADLYAYLRDTYPRRDTHYPYPEEDTHYGDLRDTHSLKDTHGDIQYTGIDNVGAFLEVAVRRFGNNPGTRFLLGEFGSLMLPKADFVICCGALNYRNSDVGHLQKMIAKLFDACTVGLGLSLLSRVDFPEGILVPCDPDEVAEYCHSLTSHVTLQIDPQDDYFTVFLYRDD